MTPEEFDYHFPWDIPRKGQFEACERIDKAFTSGKKFVILQAPTGIGKSVISYTLANYFKTMNKESYILTSQLDLQDQYTKDFEDVYTVKGASNYTCDLNKKRSCAVGVCKTSKTKMDCNCPYIKARNRAYQNPMTILNYSYFLNMSNLSREQYERSMPKDLILQKHRSLLVCDEAHNLEGELINFAELSIKLGEFKDKNVRCPRLPKKDATDEEILDWVESRLLYNLNTIKRDLSVELSSSDDSRSSSTAKSLEFVENKISSITRILSIANDGGEISINNNDGYNITLKPLYVDKYANDLMFDTSDQVIMMSATILDPNLFCKNLGIDQNDVYYLELPSLFPVENRPIYDVSSKIGKVNYQTMETAKPKMAKVIHKLLSHHKGQRGIIHTQSYKLAEYLVDVLKDDRLVLPKGPTKSKVVKDFIENDSYTDKVLISPSMTEGIDLHGDLGRFSIICKAPFASLGDPFVKKRSQLDSNWYQVETLRKFIQSCGRVTRSEDDKSSTYVLDPAISHLIRNNIKVVPDWFYNAIKVVK